MRFKNKVFFLKLSSCLSIALFASLAVQPAAGASAGSPLYGSFGANGSGTGGALGAIIDDPSSLFWNPAGLSHIYKAPLSEQALIDEAEDVFSEENFENFFDSPEEEKNQDSGMDTAPFHFQIFAGYDYLTLDRQQIFSAVGLTAFGGVVGFGFAGSQVANIPGYDASGASIGNLTYQNLAALVAFSWATGMTRMGIALNGFQENLGGTSIYGGGVNLGLQVSPIPIAHIGLNIKNLAGVYQVNSYIDAPVEKLDTVAELSFAFTTPPPKSNMKLMLAFMANLDAPDVAASIETRLGLILELSKTVYIMGGLNNNNIALGFGVNIGLFHMAYSIDQDPLVTGFQHHIELNFAF